MVIQTITSCRQADWVLTLRERDGTYWSSKSVGKPNRMGCWCSEIEAAQWAERAPAVEIHVRDHTAASMLGCLDKEGEWARHTPPYSYKTSYLSASTLWIRYLYPSRIPFNSESGSFTNTAALSSVHRCASHLGDTPDSCFTPLASLLVRRRRNNPEQCDAEIGVRGIV